MAVILSTNFDNDTTGTLPLGWSAIKGTWGVSTTSVPVSGKSLANEPTNNSDFVIYTGATAKTYQKLTFQVKISQLGPRFAPVFVGVRVGSNGGSGYLVGAEPGGSQGIYSTTLYRINGVDSYSGISSSSNITVGEVIGDVVNYEVIANGSSIEFRMWKEGSSRPSSAGASWTNSEFTSGHIALYSLGDGNSIDNLLYEDETVGPPAPVLTSPTGSGGTLTGSGTVVTDTASGTLYFFVSSNTTESDSVIKSSGSNQTVTASGTQTVNFGVLTAGTKYVHYLHTANAVDSVGVHSSAFTVTSSPATSLNLVGPSSGTVGSASSNFTVSANGSLSANCVVTPNDSSAGGTFNPVSITLSPSVLSGTFTYTAASVGTKTISATNTGGLTNPTPLSYTVGAGPVVVPVSNPNLYFSPGNWLSNGAGTMQSNNIKGASTFAVTGNRGAYLKFRVTVLANGSIKLKIDGSPLASIPNANGAPTLMWSVNGAALQTTMLTSATTEVILASSLSAGTYDVWVAHRSVWITQDGNRSTNYDAQTNVVKVTGVEISEGASISSAAIKTKKLLVFGDSITEGQDAGDGGNNNLSHDATRAYVVPLANALGCEYGQMGYWGQNWAFFNESWSNYFAGSSRLVGGLLTPMPDYIVINYGENNGDPGPDITQIGNTLSQISTAAPTAKIVLNIPFSGRARTNLMAATKPSNVYVTDLNAWQMLPGRLMWSSDGQHPNQTGHMNLGSMLASEVTRVTATPPKTNRTLSVSLKLVNNQPASNLSGLNVTFRPSKDSAAEYVSNSETTDGSGVLTFVVSTTLGSNVAGWLEVDNANGDPDQTDFNGTAGWVRVT